MQSAVVFLTRRLTYSLSGVATLTFRRHNHRNRFMVTLMTLNDLVKEYDNERGCQLERAAEQYLGRVGLWKREGEARVDQYLNKLLPLEFDFAQFRDQHPNGTHCLPDVTQPVDCLVLLVGHSFDPLFLSILAYQPRAVLLLLAKDYGNSGGQDYGKLFRSKVNNKLVKACFPTREGNGQPAKPLPLLPTRPVFLDPPAPKLKEFGLKEVVEDSPEAVFRWLQTVLLENREWLRAEVSESPAATESNTASPPRVVVDITGAKKSMVSGAFLFAAFSQTEISYVDFDRYNSEMGQPYGYSSNIGLLQNPYALYQVRDWHQVVKLFGHYQFAAAQSMLKNILAGAGSAPGIDESDLFAPSQREAISSLLSALAMYNLWENGDYHGAKQEHDKLKKVAPDVKLPFAVEALHARWPDQQTLDIKAPNKLFEYTQNHWERGTDSLYLSNKLLLAYAWDEREKINRLINYKHDFRSAFLRAHGLSETLLKARMMRLWFADKFAVQVDSDFKTLSELDAPQQTKIEKSLLRIASPKLVANSLCWMEGDGNRNCVTLNCKLGEDNRTRRLAHAKGLARSSQDAHPDFTSGSFWEKFSDLRNKAIHFCLSLSEEYAKGALANVDANLSEFVDVKNNWLNVTPQQSCINPDEIRVAVCKTLEWQVLCEACKVRFLPDSVAATNKNTI